MNWLRVPLGSVLTGIDYGTSRPVSSEGTRKVVGMKNIYGGRVETTDLPKVRDHDDVKSLILNRDDILLNRTNSPAQVGKVGIVDVDTDATFASYLVRLRLDREMVDPQYLAAYLSTDETQERIRNLATRAVSQANINPTTLRQSILVPLPSLPKQRKISDILRAWDSAITQTRDQRGYVGLKYSTAVETLGGSPTAARPLADFTHELKTRNGELRIDRQHVMGVSNRHGLIRMREQTIAQDLSRYRILPPRAFAYNPMRINIGSIAMSRLNHDVAVSPDYVLFACKTELLPEYLNHLLETSRWRHAVSAGSSGSVRTRTYYDDLARIQIPVPSLEIQQSTVTALDAIREESTLLEQKVGLLHKQKRGLAQRLFSGELRVDESSEGMSPT